MKYKETADQFQYFAASTLNIPEEDIRAVQGVLRILPDGKVGGLIQSEKCYLISTEKK